MELDRGIILDGLCAPPRQEKELLVLVLLPEYTLTASWLALLLVKVGYIILSECGFESGAEKLGEYSTLT